MLWKCVLRSCTHTICQASFQIAPAILSIQSSRTSSRVCFSLLGADYGKTSAQQLPLQTLGICGTATRFRDDSVTSPVIDPGPFAPFEARSHRCRCPRSSHSGLCMQSRKPTYAEQSQPYRLSGTAIVLRVEQQMTEHEPDWLESTWPNINRSQGRAASGNH